MSDQSKKLNKIAKPLIPTTSNFYVDVIIPFRNQYDKVIGLVEQLTRSVTYPSFNIVLVDDGSQNKFFSQGLNRIKNCKIIKNDVSVGFGASVNKAVMESKTDFICIMHSDTQVMQKNFLWNLAKSLSNNKDKKLAAVSAVTNNPMSKDCLFLKKQEATADPVEFLAPDQYLPLFCCMISRPVFLKVGKLPEFPLCWYEDRFFAKALNSHGYTLAYDPSVYVGHLGGVTVADVVRENPKNLEVLKNNRNLYQKKLAESNFNNSKNFS
jgi:GT2 family glycosyltransferase